MDNKEAIERLRLAVNGLAVHGLNTEAVSYAITVLERVEKLPELIGSSPDLFQSDIVEYLQTGKWEW